MNLRRLPIIRYIRWLYYRWQVTRWYRTWAQLGMHDGNRSSDDAILDAIWRGEQ